jgi:hypothetical protein
MDQLTREFDRLSTQQCEAMRKAVLVGMTSDEAMEYDQRHRKIAELVKKMGRLAGVLQVRNSVRPIRLFGRYPDHDY